MLSPLKRRAKKISDSNVISDELCKIENIPSGDIFKRGISKFIFDDFKSSSSEEEDNNNKTTKNKKQQSELQNKKSKAINQFKGESSLLKPSFMSMASHEDDYYQSSPYHNIQRENTLKTPPTITKRKERLKIVQNMSEINHQNCKEKALNPEKKEAFNNFNVSQNGPANNNKTIQLQKELLPKQKMNFINNFCFSQEQEEEELPNKEQKGHQVQNQVTNPTQQANIHYLQQQTQCISDHEQQEFVFSNQQRLDQNQLCQTSLIQSNGEVDQKSLYFQKLLPGRDEDNNICNLMHMPILSGTRIIFEVHVYSTLMDKSFELWLDQGRQMKLLMKTIKYSRLTKTTFDMLTYMPSSKLFCTCCTMQTNLQRNQFNIYKIMPDRNNILATICNVETLRGQKCLIMYHPKINESNSAQIISQSPLAQSLQSHYRQRQHSKIDYLTTTKISIQDRLKMMNIYGFKASKKSMQLKNKKNELKIVIGKMGSKRYRIIGGSGITPIQIFGLVIAHIET